MRSKHTDSVESGGSALSLVTPPPRVRARKEVPERLTGYASLTPKVLAADIVHVMALDGGTGLVPGLRVMGNVSEG